MYKNPIPTVDAVILLNRKLDIVLIKRKNPPHGWALPGGFVDESESFEDAVKREVKEEVGLDITALAQMYTYSDPNRDPRGHHVTTVYLAIAPNQEPKPADDAAAAMVVNIMDAVKRDDLAFDHKQILVDTLRVIEQAVADDKAMAEELGL